MIRLEPVLLHIPSAEAVNPVFLARAISDDAVAYGEALLDDPDLFVPALHLLGDVVTHTEPEDYNLTWQRMSTLLAEVQPDPPTDYVAVMGAVDLALWDLAGRKLGVPCYRMAGGRRAPRLDCTAGGLRVGQDDLERAAKRLRQQFGAVELRLSGDVQRDVPAIHRLRQALGEMAPFMADAASGYASTDDARKVGQALEQVEAFWYENPLPAGRWDEYAALREALGTALAGGRGLHALADIEAALCAGAFDIIGADLRRCGGLSAARRITDLAAIHGVRMSLHCGTSPVAQLGAAHLAAANWHVGPLQVEPTDSLLRELVVPAPVFKGGFIEVPQSPGLGARVQEAVIERYQVDIADE